MKMDINRAKELYNAVLAEDIDKINTFSIEDICDYENKTYGNIFLVAAREAKVKVAKAIIKKLEKNSISVKITENADGGATLQLPEITESTISNFIKAEDIVYKRNAWTLAAAIADSVEFLNYLSFLKGKYQDFLSGWDEFQAADEKRTIRWAIEKNSSNATDYFFRKGHFAELCARGNKNTVLYVIDYFDGIQLLEEKAIILLTPNSQGMYPLAAAIYHHHYEITQNIRKLITNWFEEIHEHPEKLKELPDDLQKKMLEIYLDDYLDTIDLSTKDNRNKEANKLISATGVTQQLKKPKIHDELIRRPYRSFKDERERQLLRQVATQIYHGFKSSNYDSTDLVEVQLMHLCYKDKHHLFIAANQGIITENLYQYLIDNSLQEVLTTKYSQNKLSEGKIRSERYAQNFKKRLYGAQINLLDSKHTADTQRANIIAKTLLKSKIKMLPIELIPDYGKKNVLNGFVLTNESKSYIRHALRQEDTIYVVVVKNCSHEERHAEEFLVDIRDCIEDSKDLHSCIAGKKRPCMGCSSRMQNKIDQYGRFPGGFWVNTIETQTPEVAKNTLKLLFTNSTHSSCQKDPDKDIKSKALCEDYDSGSESEENESNPLPTLPPQQ